MLGKGRDLKLRARPDEPLMGLPIVFLVVNFTLPDESRVPLHDIDRRDFPSVGSDEPVDVSWQCGRRRRPWLNPPSGRPLAQVECRGMNDVALGSEARWRRVDRASSPCSLRGSLSFLVVLKRPTRDTSTQVSSMP